MFLPVFQNEIRYFVLQIIKPIIRFVARNSYFFVKSIKSFTKSTEFGNYILK